MLSLKLSMLALVIGVFYIPQAQASSVSVGLDSTSFNYVEELTFPKKSEESANYWAPFVRAEFTLPTIVPSSISIEGKTSGTITTDYNGSTLSTGAPVRGVNPATFFDLEADYRITLLRPSIQAFAGLGLHYWDRFLAGGSGYRELYSLPYLPLGISFQTPVSPGWLVGFELTYEVMFSGKLKVVTSETVIAGEDTTLDLGNRSGYKIRGLFRYEVLPQFGLNIQPWYEMTSIGVSNEVYNKTFDEYIHEPASKTVRQGILISGDWVW